MDFLRLVYLFCRYLDICKYNNDYSFDIIIKFIFKLEVNKIVKLI